MRYALSATLAVATLISLGLAINATVAANRHAGSNSAAKTGLAEPSAATSPTTKSAYKSPNNLATVPMKVGSIDYTLEIAKTPADRQRGLMFRSSMPDDWGMIFVFPATMDADHGFWMKNTLIPLDILYVTDAGKVVSIHRMHPHDETSVNPSGPYKYAIELNAGQAAKNGIKPGDVLVIPPGAKTTTE